MTLESVLPIPDLFAARRVLCIQPHYDDNDIAAAGTLALLSRAGADLVYCTVTDDLMGVVEGVPAEEAAAMLQRDQHRAAEIVGVREQVWLGYPDAGEYDYFAVRRDLLGVIRRVRPDFIFTVDPWLTYEAHRDHIQTGMAAAEATIFAGLTRIASSDPAADAAWDDHDIQGIAFYFTREPNVRMDISPVWAEKVAVLRCYETQFDPPDMEQLVMALEKKARQTAAGLGYEFAEPLKVLHTSALHCGI
jgi:LmbE family N-acetylglucosaminyl deacetylase